MSEHTDFLQERLIQAQHEMIDEQMRPFHLLKPAIGIDGNQYFFLYGTNLMEGVCGFGDTPQAASHDFDRNWHTSNLFPIAKAEPTL
jgi:hypothetical protein